MQVTHWVFAGTGHKKLSFIKPAVTKKWPDEVTDCGAGYGVMAGAMDCRDATLEAGFRYLYCDGPYWLARKPSHVRLCAQWLWHLDGPDRQADLDKAGCTLKDWSQGDAIVVAPSHDFVHRKAYKDGGADKWTADTIAELKKHTDRPIVVRKKDDGGPPANIDHRIKSMDAVFATAWAIVTAGSTIGVEAVCRGVPAFSTQHCATSQVGLEDLSRIESPFMPDMDERRQWAMNLAARQFNVDDLSSGKAVAIMREDMAWNA